MLAVLASMIPVGFIPSSVNRFLAQNGALSCCHPYKQGDYQSPDALLYLCLPIVNDPSMFDAP